MQSGYAEGLDPNGNENDIWKLTLSKLHPHLTGVNRIDQWGTLTQAVWDEILKISPTKGPGLKCLCIRMMNTKGDRATILGRHHRTALPLTGLRQISSYQSLTKLHIERLLRPEVYALAKAVRSLDNLGELFVASASVREIREDTLRSGEEAKIWALWFAYPDRQ